MAAPGTRPPPANNTPAMMMLTVALKRFIAHCSSGLSKVIIFAERGFCLLSETKGAGVVIQYCNIASGGLRSIYGVQSRVKSREILHDYTGACDDTAIISGFTRQ